MAIAHDADSNTGSNGASSLTWSHTCTGSNLCLIVGINASDETVTTSSVKYNGVSMIFAKRQVNANDGNWAEIWYLANPATGANNVVATFSENMMVMAGAVSLTGVDQTNPLDATAGASGDSNPVTVNITSVADNAWAVDSVQASAQTDTPVVGAGQTSSWIRPQSTSHGMGSYEGPKTPAGSITMSWSNIQVFREWATAVATFKPAAEGGGGGPSITSSKTLLGVGA